MTAPFIYWLLADRQLTIGMTQTMLATRLEQMTTNILLTTKRKIMPHGLNR